MKRYRATIGIPRESRALRKDVEAALSGKFESVNFTFSEGDVDSACHVVATDGFKGPALAEAIQAELKRIERKYR